MCNIIAIKIRTVLIFPELKKLASKNKWCQFIFDNPLKAQLIKHVNFFIQTIRNPLDDLVGHEFLSIIFWFFFVFLSYLLFFLSLAIPASLFLSV